MEALPEKKRYHVCYFSFCMLIQVVLAGVFSSFMQTQEIIHYPGGYLEVHFES